MKLILTEVRDQPRSARARAKRLDLLEAIVDTLDDVFGVAGATAEGHADTRKERKQATSDQGRPDVR